MTVLLEYVLFFAKVATGAVAILLVFAGILSLRRRHKQGEGLQVESLNKHYEALSEDMHQSVLSKKSYQVFRKDEKQKARARKKDKYARPRVFVVDFKGNMMASCVESFREIVTAILTIAAKEDEVVVRLESPGGVVSQYGLAASELARIRTAGIPLTAIIDRVAASGGYLMAAVADKILAAPFAVVGSIGVVAQMPNFHRFLEKHNIDVELVTSGEFKRTLTLFGENTKAGREKFQSQLDDIHDQFKNHIGHYRPQLNLEQVANGDFWLADQAFELRLIDGLTTSDDYLVRASKTRDVYLVNYRTRPTHFWQKVMKTCMTHLSQMWV